MLPAALKLPALTAAAATATFSAAAPAASESATSRLGTSFVDVQRPAVHLGSIQLCDGRIRALLIRHLHEGEATRLASVPIRNNVDPFDSAELRKCGVQLVLRGLIAQIPYENVSHTVMILV
jgi:hypothetical protein